MIAQGNQPGWYSVTAKGLQVGTAANLRTHLAELNVSLGSARIPAHAR